MIMDLSVLTNDLGSILESGLMTQKLWVIIMSAIFPKFLLIKMKRTLNPFPRLSGYDMDQLHLDHLESSNWLVLNEPEIVVIIANWFYGIIFEYDHVISVTWPPPSHELWFSYQMIFKYAKMSHCICRHSVRPIWLIQNKLYFVTLPYTLFIITKPNTVLVLRFWLLV